MNHDFFEPVSQGIDRAQDEENCRIKEIADELERLCQLHEAQFSNGKADVNVQDLEFRTAEQYAKAHDVWIPIMQIFDLGIPGPSGNENDTYVADDVIYKVNNLMNSKTIINLFRKVLMHNNIFPDTAYQFHGFTGFEGRTIQPVFKQPRIEKSSPATQIMIDTYMSALGFQKTGQAGSYSNGMYDVWDVLPRNVLVDAEGDIYVIDAEISIHIHSS